MNSGLVSPDQWHSVSIKEEIDEEILTAIVEICVRVMPIRRSNCSSLQPIEFMAQNDPERQARADLVSHVIADQLARQVILTDSKPALSAEIDSIIATAAGLGS